MHARLDHLLAADALGTAPDAAGRARAESVLASFGFLRDGAAWCLDDTFAWVTVTTADDAAWHVHVVTPLPGHLVEQVSHALDGLVTEAGFVRIDVFTRGQIPPLDWAARIAALSETASRRGFP